MKDMTAEMQGYKDQLIRTRRELAIANIRLSLLKSEIEDDECTCPTIPVKEGFVITVACMYCSINEIISEDIVSVLADRDAYDGYVPLDIRQQIELMDQENKH